MIRNVSPNMGNFLKALGTSGRNARCQIGDKLTITANKAASNGMYIVEKTVKNGDKTVTGRFTYDAYTKCLVPHRVTTTTPKGVLEQSLTPGTFISNGGYYPQIGKLHVNGKCYAFDGRITKPENIREIVGAKVGTNGGMIGEEILTPEQFKNLVNKNIKS